MSPGSVADKNISKKSVMSLHVYKSTNRIWLSQGFGASKQMALLSGREGGGEFAVPIIVKEEKILDFEETKR